MASDPLLGQSDTPQRAPHEERCPRCHGKGTIVKDGPHRDEYDSQYPCPRCTTDRTALKGTGWVPACVMEPRS